MNDSAIMLRLLQEKLPQWPSGTANRLYWIGSKIARLTAQGEKGAFAARHRLRGRFHGEMERAISRVDWPDDGMIY